MSNKPATLLGCTWYNRCVDILQVFVGPLVSDSEAYRHIVYDEDFRTDWKLNIEEASMPHLSQTYDPLISETKVFSSGQVGIPWNLT